MVIGILAVGMVLACLRVISVELGHELDVHELRVQARELRNARYRHALELQRQADEVRAANRAARQRRRMERQHCTEGERNEPELAQAA